MEPLIELVKTAASVYNLIYQLSFSSHSITSFNSKLTTHPHSRHVSPPFSTNDYCFILFEETILFNIKGLIKPIMLLLVSTTATALSYLFLFVSWFFWIFFLIFEEYHMDNAVRGKDGYIDDLMSSTGNISTQDFCVRGFNSI